MSTTIRAARAHAGAGVLVVVLALLATLIAPSVSPAHADAGMEGQFVAEINRERAAIGLPALSTAGDLTSAARKHSGVMADATDLHHNPNLGGDVGGWQKVGENVGRGPNVSALHTAFMNSPGHKANVLDPVWTQVGVGVVVRDGTVWVTAVFRLPEGAASPAAAPEPEPEPAPQPEPEPAAPAPAPGPDAEPEPTPVAEPEPVEEGPAEPEPHEVIDQPLPLDRVTLILAREEAAERSMRMSDVLD